MRGALLAMLLGLPVEAAPRILVVTATAGFRHESIETAEGIVAQLASARGVPVAFARTDVEMVEQLTAANLRTMTAVFFVNTSGELPIPALDALLTWIREGGTFVGFHSASDTWHGSPEYIEMLGAEFAGHPPDYEATIVVADATHAATKALPSPHVMLEEIYTFTNHKPLFVRRLLTLAPEGAPLAWEKSYSRGRVLYSALGHREDVWLSGWFATFVAGAIDWALEPRAAMPRRRAVRP